MIHKHNSDTVNLEFDLTLKKDRGLLQLITSVLPDLDQAVEIAALIPVTEEDIESDTQFHESDSDFTPAPVANMVDRSTADKAEVINFDDWLDSKPELKALADKIMNQDD